MVGLSPGNPVGLLANAQEKIVSLRDSLVLVYVDQAVLMQSWKGLMTVACIGGPEH